MTGKNHIQAELNVLGSDLIHYPEPPFVVPEGYFDGFAASVLQRIASESTTLPQNINTPYTVPNGYFDSLPMLIMERVKMDSFADDPQKEIAAIGPLLTGIGKKTPYSVPAGYFDNLQPVPIQAEKSSVKVVRMGARKWMHYAAAAIVTGIIALSGWFHFNQGSPIDPAQDPQEWVASKLKNVPSNEIDNFIQYSDAGLSTTETANTVQPEVEVKDLLKDISDSELQEFVEETEAVLAEETIFLN